MKILVRYILLVLIAGSALGCSQNTPLHKQVNPFIGTGGHGHTYPGATSPFGMVQLSPDTRLDGWDGCGGYHYSDSVIYGFSHTHLQGTGVSDYGDILIMPCTQFKKADKWRDRYKSEFRKTQDSEYAHAGYYTAHLDDHGITAELTTTERTGIHKYTLDKPDTVTMIIDLDHRDKLINYSIYPLDDSTIVGHRISDNWATEQHVYFAMRFDKKFDWKDQLSDQTDYYIDADGTEHREMSFVPVFAVDFGIIEELVVKVGLSFCDIDGALLNLNTEAPHYDFNKYKKANEALWDDQLGIIELEGGTSTEKTTFYSALYHSCTVPNLASDVDGRYRGTDLEVHQLSEGEGRHYTIFSLWDTFRALHPLLSWLEPERTNEFVNTMLRMYEDGGQLPVWELAGNYTGCMIGYHSVPVISEAQDWGINDFDKNLALEAMIQAADSAHLGLDFYAEKGYIPSECESESVSKTLEYAFDDACISSFAESLGETETAERFRNRSLSWRNLMHPTSTFIQPKRDGAWIPDYHPTEVNFNYTEANGWQYTFFAPHDISGQIDIAGSNENYFTLVDNQFTTDEGTSGREQPDITGLIGQYAHGNEPSHHVAYLFNYTGHQYRTVELVDSILTHLYSDEPDGYCGNEDCGQMSAWYVLSSLGLYPVAPGSGTAELAISSPLFDKATITPRGGNTTVISRDSEKKYVESVNGSKASFVSYSDVVNGTELKFNMTDDRQSGFGLKEEMRPKERIDDSKFVAVPSFIAPQSFQGESIEVIISSIEEDGVSLYHMGDGNWLKYENPVVVNKSCEFFAKTQRGDYTSKTVHHSVVKIDHDWKVVYTNPYSHQYAAAGENTLVDGLYGGTEFRTGDWQGFYEEPFEATIDFEERLQINGMRIGFVQDIKPWIWLPKNVEFQYSNDGVNFKSLDIVDHKIAQDDYEKQVYRFNTNKSVNARYVRVKATTQGKIPDWHLGGGHDRWTFVDEWEIITD